MGLTSNLKRTSEDSPDDLLREQVRLAFQHLPTMQMASFIVSLVISYVVRETVPAGNILAWILMVLAIVLARIVLYYRFTKVCDGLFAGEYWKNAYLRLAFISGTVWGMSAFIIFPAGNLVLTFLFILVIASLSAATTVSHSSIRWAPSAWSGPALLLFAARCALEGGEVGYTLGFLILIYLSTIVRYSFTHNRAIASAIALKFENLELLAELRKANDGLSQDITERKRAEEALRESEEKFRSLFDNSLDGILLTAPDGSIIAANEAACKMIGWTEQELCERSRNHVVAAAKHTLASALEERMRTGRFRGEFELKRKDGTTFPVELSSTLFRTGRGEVRASTIFRDITERKRAERALRISEETARAFINGITESAFLIDTKGTCLAMNKTTAERLGKQPEQMLGTSIYDHLPDDVKANRKEKVEEVLTEGVPVRFEDERSGRRIINTVYPVFEADGSITRLAILGVDITDQKQAEEERLRFEQRLYQAQKAESLGRMAGAIAHHFNNLIGAVMGRMELALGDLHQASQPRRHIAEAMKASRRAVEISRLMLTYLGHTVQRKEPCDLIQTVREALLLVHPTLPQTVHLQTDFSSEAMIIQGDKAHIKQVLTNLILNAGEAIGDGHGQIIVAVRTMAAEALREFRFFPSGWEPEENSYACLSISDNGSGLDTATRDRLFDPFFSTKLTGRGLGLAVVLGVVKAHGGAIAVESQPGRGATFQVFFPIPLQEPLLPEVGRTVAFTPFARGGLVLVVEDEPAVRHMAEAMLRRFGYEVISAGDGFEALEMFRKRKDEVLLVLLDLSMPRMNGWETLAALRALRPDIPVILASGYDEAQVMQEHHSELFLAFLHKPYQMVDLEAALGVAQKPLTPSKE